MKVFLMQLWNISYQAAMIICIILLVRQIFSWMKVPKKISYCLWLIPFLRMLCPWTIESTFSLLPIREVNQVVGQVMEYTDTGNAGMLQQDGNPAPGQRIPAQILPTGSLLPVSRSPELQRSANEGWTWITIAGGDLAVRSSGVTVLQPGFLLEAKEEADWQYLPERKCLSGRPYCDSFCIRGMEPADLSAFRNWGSGI